ncbi:Fanconi anemia protein FANCD2 [Dillenia turbinata]|uniref:Fanconi anemia protein FANCD2 n=1 Tax=Dillenia turbinata TaxID=194707 RepID=A0AAN8YYF8_9MAGN
MSLSEKQKQILCHSLYFATNWIRELLNAFCTQIVERSECTSQAAKEEIIAKLLRRIQNLVFLESLLNDFLKRHPISLPELGPCMEHSKLGHMERKMNEQRKIQGSTLSKKKGKQAGIIEASSNSNINDKLKQPTIVDVLRKAGAITSQAMPNDSSSCLSSMRKAPGSQEHHTGDSSEPMVAETCSVAKILEEQRFKFRPLLLDCYSILTHVKCQDSCCPDPVAELPLHLYIVRDLHYKLKYFSPPSKQFSASNFVAPPCLRTMTMREFLLGTKTLFPSLKKYLDVTANILKDSDNFQEHWEVHSASSANEDIAELVISKDSVSKAVFQEVLQCFSLILNFPGIHSETVVLVDLLKAFQPPKVLDSLFSGLEPIPLPGKVDYLYAGAYSFLEGVFDIACSMSFLLASEVVLTLEAVVSSVQKFLDQSERNGKTMSIGINKGVLLILHRRLKASAEKLLRHNFDNSRFESDWKSKGDTLQKILHIFLENSDSTSILLNELACSVLPKVSPCKGPDDTCPGFPTLQSRTFVVWYRVLHEENLAILNKVVEEVFMMDKLRTGVRVEDKETLLTRLKHSVNVIVSLVNLCRIHDKVTVHTMAVKYGGKFVDSFLKVFPFLQSQFTTHSQPIIQTVKELQKATRTLQTLCSEAKGLKQMAITRSIPATKRSLERFLFQVKALVHATSSECTFWMGM